MELTPAQHRNFDRLVKVAKGMVAKRAKLAEGDKRIEYYNTCITRYENMAADGLSTDAVEVFRTLINEA